MKHRVYYGEYTLSHWVELILKKNIILPPYQRHFVWKEDAVLRFIKTLENDEFVPPVIIGFLKAKSEKQNLILDGQQRLTSILLAYYNVMPDYKTFKIKQRDTGNYAEGDELEEYENGENGENDVLNWTFENLIGTTIGSITKESILQKGNYKVLNLSLPEDFFETRYLGFSYIIPQVSNVSKSQGFYSSVFRNINFQGVPLLSQESRNALYYFNGCKSDFFAPSCCENIKISYLSSASQLDFVRYMSLLSQYKKNQSSACLARGFRSNMEGYYENYVYSVLEKNDDDTYGKFEDIFPEEEYQQRLRNLGEAIAQIGLSSKEFPSIIDMDAYFFGLIYYVVIEGKKLNVGDNGISELKEKIDNNILAYKSDSHHQQVPNAFRYMRKRVGDSIGLYSGYVQ